MQHRSAPESTGASGYGVRRWLNVAALGAAALPLVGMAAGVPCTGGVLGTAAQVVKIEPTETRINKLTPRGETVALAAGDALCHGDSVLVPSQPPQVRLVLYAGGEHRVLEPGQQFTAPRERPSVLAEAAVLLDSLRARDGTLRSTPDVSSPRASRAPGGGNEAPAMQIAPLRTLRELPRQRLTPDVTPTLAWREGLGPYTCMAVSEFGDPLWQQEVDASHSSCAVPPGLQAARQFQVRESRGPTVVWNLRWETWPAVPRPSWVPPDASNLGPPERTAWAMWLWQSGPPEWRLQALGMLNLQASKEWAAGHLRDLILDNRAPRNAP